MPAHRKGSYLSGVMLIFVKYILGKISFGKKSFRQDFVFENWKILLQYDLPHSHTSNDYEQKMKVNLKAWVTSGLPYLAAFFRCIELITPTVSTILIFFTLLITLGTYHIGPLCVADVLFFSMLDIPPSDSPVVGGFELEELDHIVEDGKDDDDDHIPQPVTNTSLKSKLWANPILEKVTAGSKRNGSVLCVTHTICINIESGIMISV